MSTFIEDLQAEVKELEKSGLLNSLVVVNAFLDNPDKRLFIAISKLVNALSAEIEKLTNGGVTDFLNGDDKVFERLNVIITKYKEYGGVIQSGKEIAGTVSEKEDDDGDFLTNQAKKHQKA